MSKKRACAGLLAVALLASCAGRPVQETPGQERVQGAAAAACAWRAGPGSGLIVSGPMIIDGALIGGQALYAEGGLIRQLAQASSVEAAHPDASVLACQGSYISPGFVNAHEHTSYSYQKPGTVGSSYEHRDQWRAVYKPQPNDSESAMTWVEARHLLHGVTAIAGSGAATGIVKNASSPAQSDASRYEYRADMQTFPFGPDVLKDYGQLPCGADGSQLPPPKTNANAPLTSAYVPHVGEGTNCTARLEIDAYLRNIPPPAQQKRKYSMIHGLAVQPAQVATIRRDRVSVIWSPRSNLALYGKTLDAAALLDQGVSVALGTDWSPSGSYTMPEEIACAAQVSAAKGSRALSGRELWSMATIEAARAIGLDDRTGSIAPGKAADLVVVRDPGAEGVSRIASLGPDDFIAVLVDGELRAADARQLAQPPARCRHRIGEKLLCLDMAADAFETIRAGNQGNLQPLSLDGQKACTY